MIVAKTTKEDVEAIQANQYFLGSKNILIYSLDYQHCYSFHAKGEVIAIATFYEYYSNCFRSGIIFSKDINPFFLRSFKKWMKKKKKEMNCIRLETEGISDITLERFHKFLGFKKEVIINNGEYIKWVM